MFRLNSVKTGRFSARTSGSPRAVEDPPARMRTRQGGQAVLPEFQKRDGRTSPLIEALKVETAPLVGSLSIVVPVYNAEQSLPLLLARLDALLPDLAHNYEVILVNDGSRDQSAKVLDEEVKLYRWMRVVHLMRNFGQHNALLCGIRRAAADVIVTIDDDLQNPPEEIPKLLVKLTEGYDVIYGFPEQESHGFLRNLASRITKSSLQQAMGVETARRISSFRAFRASIRDAFQDYRGAFVSVDVLLSWGTTRFTAIPVSNPPRPFGVSNYTLRKLLVHAMNMMTGFSTLPLRVASLAGFAFALFGFLTLTYVLGRYLLIGHSVPGFPFLASLISILAGAQLFALGIIGEYLGRMHFRLLDRPSYAIRSAEGFNRQGLATAAGSQEGGSI
jgi:glycosyltransferase involved in cell wall biosynthesis